MKRLSVILVICMMLFVCNCGKEQPSAEKEQQKQTNQLLNEVNRQIGMPNIKNFQQKKLMKMIFELCDMEKLECYLYLWSPYLGKFVYVNKCIGYGIPFSAQYTSPMKGENVGTTGFHEYAPMPQADPNMLYMPTSSSATWIIVVDDEDNIKVGYFEPEIIILPFILDNRLVLNSDMNGK